MSKVFKKGFFVLALLSLFGCSTTRAPDQNSMSGNWHGKISLPEQALYISVELQQKRGSWTGSIDIPQERLAGFPLTEISVDGADVRFSIPGIPGDPGFEGSLVDGRISGEYRQSGESREFYLGREPLDIPGMLTAEQAASVIDGHLAAFNAHDLDAFIEFFHPDIEVFNFPNELDKSGLESLRESFVETFKMQPYEKVVTRIIDRNHVIDQVEVTFQFNGHAMSDRSTVIYTLEDGLIRRMTFL